MYQIGETVVYGASGVCNVVSIGPLSMHGVDRKKQYYTLQPIYQDGSVYVPLEGEKRQMRLPLTREEAEELIARIPDIAPCDIQNFNYKQRTDAFAEAMRQNTCEGLVQVIKAVVQKQQRFRDKQQYNADSNYLKRAMTLLCGELAYAIGDSVDNVRTRVDTIVRKSLTVESVE